jgi:CopA family copper-resistance protein
VIFRTLLFLALYPMLALGATVSYEFDIGTMEVNVTGTAVEALAIDGQIPAPTLRAAVGDTLRITFNNRLAVTTSVHWHGILLPADQDGVPFLNTEPIAAGGSHTFEFPILHSGTFWYHSHTDLQIQQGLYGAIILESSDETTIQDEVVLFSDWTDEDPEMVLANLKKSDDYYAWKKDKVQSWDRVIANGSRSISNRFNSAWTRMGPMDLTDVGYDAFLVNGEPVNTLAVDDPAATQMKLRLVNGSTSSYYDVEYAGGPMTVVAADGQNIEPIRVKRLRIATAETYDVLVPLSSGLAYELRASSFDGTGFSSLFVGDGQRVPAPDVPPPNLYLMEHMDMSSMDMDMGMGMEINRNMDMDAGDHAQHAVNPVTTPDHQDGPVSDHAAGHGAHQMPGEPMPETPTVGLESESPVIDHMTDYRHLIASSSTSLPADQPWRDIRLRLTGNMERYVWSFDGKTIRENPQILIRGGENVRFHLSNETMMHHPLHLHGHFFRVVNEQGERSPLKHTVNIPPMGHVMIEFDGSETQDWLFHCHNQYHMKSGMNRVVSYEQTSHFTPDLAQLVVPSQRWFRLSEFHLLSSFMDYEFTLMDERHSFELELDADLEDSLELHLFYNYHFNRFVSAFGGLERREHHHGKNHDLPVAGLNVMLPLRIESEWRVDDHGEFRLELESEVRLTRRWGLDWRWNTDDEHRYGINYRVNNRFSITLHTDTEYGDAIGIQFFY